MKRKNIAGIVSVIVLLAPLTTVSGIDLVKERDGFSAQLIRKLDVSPGGNLEMKDIQGDVNITGAPLNQVEVVQEFFFKVKTEEEAQQLFERIQATVAKSGNSVQVIGQDRNHRHITQNFKVKIPEKYNVEVNSQGGEILLRQVKGTVYLETRGGNVEISQVTGDLTVETAGGGIDVRNVEGAVSMETAGGNLKLQDASKRPFILRTSGGGITLLGITGNLRASTSGGEVEARHIVGDLDLATSGGEIILEDVKGSSHKARTSGGDVEARNVEGNLEMKTSGGEVCAIQIKGNFYGRTAGGDVEVSMVTGDADVSTSGGDLDIEGVAGSLSGKTSGGDIRTRVYSKDKLGGPIILSSDGGDIEIELPSTVKATIAAEIRLLGPSSDYTISSDFDVRIEEKDEKSKRKGLFSNWSHTVTATGDINGGGSKIELTTTEGDIVIEKID